MAKDPAFLMYSQDFYIGTIDFTNEEVGQFLRILLLEHQKGRMNKENIYLMVGPVSEKVLSKFKTDSEGMLYNERFEFEAKKRANYTKSRSKNRSTPNKKKKSHMKNISVSHVKHMEDEDEDENKNEDLNKVNTEGYDDGDLE